MTKLKETKLVKIVPNIWQDSRDEKKIFLKCYWPSKVLQNSKEKVSKSDLQDKAEEAHQPSQYRALSKISKLPLSEIHVGHRESYAGRVIVTEFLGFFKSWAPTANPLAQFESNQLLAHFSSIFLQLEPNLSLHITQNFRKLLDIDLAHSRILPRPFKFKVQHFRAFKQSTSLLPESPPQPSSTKSPFPFKPNRLQRVPLH